MKNDPTATAFGQTWPDLLAAVNAEALNLARAYTHDFELTEMLWQAAAGAGFVLTEQAVQDWATTLRDRLPQI